MQLVKTLNKDQADAMFNQEAVLFGSLNGVPEYRIIEIFGEWASTWIESNIHIDGYFKPGTDWNGRGSCSEERPFIRYFYRSGFHKIISENNYRLVVKNHRESTAGRIVDQVWQARHERLETE